MYIIIKQGDKRVYKSKSFKHTRDMFEAIIDIANKASKIGECDIYIYELFEPDYIYTFNSNDKYKIAMDLFYYLAFLI